MKKVLEEERPTGSVPPQRVVVARLSSDKATCKMILLLAVFSTATWMFWSAYRRTLGQDDLGLLLFFGFALFVSVVATPLVIMLPRKFSDGVWLHGGYLRVYNLPDEIPIGDVTGLSYSRGSVLGYLNYGAGLDTNAYLFVQGRTKSYTILVDALEGGPRKVAEDLRNALAAAGVTIPAVERL